MGNSMERGIIITMDVVICMGPRRRLHPPMGGMGMGRRHLTRIHPRGLFRRLLIPLVTEGLEELEAMVGRQEEVATAESSGR